MHFLSTNVFDNGSNKEFGCENVFDRSQQGRPQPTIYNFLF
jgi:hypothetical protein